MFAADSKYDQNIYIGTVIYECVSPYTKVVSGVDVSYPAAALVKD